MDEPITLHPIGVIHSPYKAAKGTPIQGILDDKKAQACVELKEKGSTPPSHNAAGCCLMSKLKNRLGPTQRGRPPASHANISGGVNMRCPPNRGA
jgi:hypothetical protein